jgi:hypothetical protein
VFFLVTAVASGLARTDPSLLLVFGGGNSFGELPVLATA